MRVARHEFLPSRGKTFDDVLVWGIPLHDAPIMLRQASSVVTPGEGRIRLLESRTASRFVRVGVEPLDSVVDAIQRMGVSLRRQALDGTEAEEIVQHAVTGRHDLVVKGIADAHERRRTPAAADLALVRRCPCPVWFVECAEHRPPRRILVALDPNARTGTDRALSVQVATLGAGLAGTLQGELHVLHVWAVFGEQLMRNRVSRAELDYSIRAELAAAHHTSEAILAESSLDVPPARIHFRKGVFEYVLTAFAADGDFDLIVMGTRGRKGWLDAVVRPHAEKSLSQTPISILVVPA